MLERLLGRRSKKPERPSNSVVRSQETTRPDPTGPIPIDLVAVLEQAWLSTFTTKSDFARAHADGVATASSLGLITTQTDENTFGRLWVITPKGLMKLWEMKGLDNE